MLFSKNVIFFLPINFCPKNVVCFYICCFYSDALQIAYVMEANIKNPTGLDKQKISA